jgi:transposase
MFVMLSNNVAGIDPHQANFTVGIVDSNGVEICHGSFDNTAEGYTDTIDLLTTHSVGTVGVEGSAKLGAHVSVALMAGGFDCREVPPQRSAMQRRARRLDKTDTVDAYSTARALLAEPSLGPVQTLETFDPLLAELEAVLEHRRMLVSARTLQIEYVADQISKLPTDIRDQLDLTGKVETRLRKLAGIDGSDVSTQAGGYRLSWLKDFIDRDKELTDEIKTLGKLIQQLLNQHGTTLRDEDGIGPISAATLLCEIGDPTRFPSESKFARWCGTGAVALSSGEGKNQPTRHRLDTGGNRRINSVLHIISVTQSRVNQKAIDYLQRKTGEGKTRREARRAHKRHLANRVIRRVQKDYKHQQQLIQI